MIKYYVFFLNLDHDTAVYSYTSSQDCAGSPVNLIT